MLVEQIRKQLEEAVRSNNVIAKNILRLALGEIQTAQSKKDISEEEQQKVVRKIIASNEETIKLDTNVDRLDILAQENVILLDLLPKLWTEEQIKNVLNECVEPIKAAKSDGHAIGLCMKTLKALDATVSGDIVSKLVKEIRA